MKEYVKMLKNAFNFEGRTRRREYWIPVLINTSILVVLYGIMFLGASLMGETLFYNTGTSVGFNTRNSLMATLLWIPYSLFSLYVFVIQLGLTVRRLHDTGKPGWVYAILLLGSLCCGIGAIVLLVFCCLDSKEDNQWGPNPKMLGEEDDNRSTAVAVTVIVYVVAVLFATGAIITNVFADSSIFGSNQGGRTITTEDFGLNTTEEITEEITEAPDTTEEGTQATTEDGQTGGVADSVMLKLDDFTQITIPVPVNFSVEDTSEYGVYFTAEDSNISFSSSVWNTREEALESLKSYYNSYVDGNSDIVTEESVEVAETEVSGNPVYYCKVVENYSSFKFTSYQFFIDLGAENMLELDVNTSKEITDEQALSLAKFTK